MSSKTEDITNVLELDKYTELSSYENSSETEEISNDKEIVYDINDTELSKKETFYYKIIDRYYKSLELKKIEMMIDIIEGKSKISLRLLDWFVTRYANKYKVRFEKTENKNVLDCDDKFDKKIDNGFNVHISYKAQLKSYKKRYFDPFRRRKKFRYYFDKDRKICLITTIGQLNFFKWAFVNNVIEYVNDNYNAISKAMVNTNKIDKTRKLKEKKDKECVLENNMEKEEITIKKNGINVSAKKRINKGEVQIVLSFD
jgi:hypothetical protein